MLSVLANFSSSVLVFIEFGDVHTPVTQAMSTEIESSLSNALIDPIPRGILSCNIGSYSMRFKVCKLSTIKAMFELNKNLILRISS